LVLAAGSELLGMPAALPAAPVSVVERLDHPPDPLRAERRLQASSEVAMDGDQPDRAG